MGWMDGRVGWWEGWIDGLMKGMERWDGCTDEMDSWMGWMDKRERSNCFNE